MWTPSEGFGGLGSMWIEGKGDLPGRLIIISGPSGSGKTTLVRRLLRHPELNARLSISTTTRAPRPGESEGVNYNFTDEQSFDAMVENREFLEHVFFAGHKYGTPAQPVFE